MIYPPREGDLPRDELVKVANRETGPHGQWPGATVNFKYTCPHCGTRCTLQEDNTLYEEGECFQCGRKSKIEYGGFMIHYTINKKANDE